MPLIDNFEFNFPGRMMNQQVCNRDSLKSVLLTLLAIQISSTGRVQISSTGRVQISSLITQHTLKGTRDCKVPHRGLVSNVNCQSAKRNTMKHYWQVFNQVRFNLSIATPSPVSQHKNYLTSLLSHLNDKEKHCLPTAKSQKCPAPVEELLTC